MPCVQTYSSPLGEILLLGQGEQLLGLWFHGQKHQLPEPGRYPTGEAEAFLRAERWLDLYFAGARPEAPPLLAPRGTPFQQRVWQRLRAIPYGGFLTYGELARELGSSPRAVGSAVGRNPISLMIPCHRVLGQGGSLTGYAGGLDRKKALLNLEGIIFREEKGL